MVVSGRHLKACAFCGAETGKTALYSWHGARVRSRRGLCAVGVGILAWPAVPGPHTVLCPSTSPNSSPSPRSPNAYETGVGGGKTPSV